MRQILLGLILCTCWQLTIVQAETLSLHQALTLGMEHNFDLQVASLDLERADAGVLGEQGRFDITAELKCIIVTEMVLEDMPPIALQFIRAQARQTYYIDQEGSGPKMQSYTQKVNQKEAELVTLNMKHTDANYFSSLSYAQFSTRRPATNSTFTKIQ